MEERFCPSRARHITFGRIADHNSFTDLSCPAKTTAFRCTSGISLILLPASSASSRYCSNSMKARMICLTRNMRHILPARLTPARRCGSDRRFLSEDKFSPLQLDKRTCPQDEYGTRLPRHASSPSSLALFCCPSVNSGSMCGLTWSVHHCERGVIWVSLCPLHMVRNSPLSVVFRFRMGLAFSIVILGAITSSSRCASMSGLPSMHRMTSQNRSTTTTVDGF